MCFTGKVALRWGWILKKYRFDVGPRQTIGKTFNVILSCSKINNGFRTVDFFQMVYIDGAHLVMNHHSLPLLLDS